MSTGMDGGAVEATARAESREPRASGRGGLWNRLRRGLGRTRNGLAGRISTALGGAARIDEDVLDRIMAAPRAREVLAEPPEQPTVAELRKRHGTVDDDELILRALVPAADLEKMRAAGPVKRDFPLLSTPELEEVRKLMALSTSKYVELETATISVSLRRGD